jgi:hypothetical protein
MKRNSLVRIFIPFICVDMFKKKNQRTCWRKSFKRLSISILRIASPRVGTRSFSLDGAKSCEKNIWGAKIIFKVDFIILFFFFEKIIFLGPPLALGARFPKG